MKRSLHGNSTQAAFDSVSRAWRFLGFLHDAKTRVLPFTAIAAVVAWNPAGNARVEMDASSQMLSWRDYAHVGAK